MEPALVAAPALAHGSRKLAASLLWPSLAAGLAGLAHAASIAWPPGTQDGTALPLWWLQVLAMAALVALLHNTKGNWRAAFWLAWAFATAWLCGTFWWLYISLHTYGGLAAPITVLAIGVLAAGLALYYALMCMLFVALAPSNPAGSAMLFAACWTLAELARDVFFTGFPWGAAGYAHVDGPLASTAALWGVNGIGFVVAFGIALGVATLRKPTLGRCWLMVFSFSLLASVATLSLRTSSDAAGFSVPHPTPSSWYKAPDVSKLQPLSVTLLQGNIAQDEKFQVGSGVPQALRWYREQLLAAKTQLVVAPETAIPLLPAQMPDGYWEALQQHFAQRPVTLSTPGPQAAPSSAPQAALIGVPLGSFSQGYTNSAIGLSTSGSYQYHKHHLVPFGEFIPYGFRWFTEMMNMPLGDFNRGDVGQASLAFADQRLAPNICYEDLFGEELGQRFKDPATAPTIFVNISNIGWFGNSVAIDEHLHISRMRAIEFQRPMIRATNTGPTVIINHLGEVTHSLPPHTRGALVGQVQGRSGITPFAWWVSRYGLAPLWLLALGIVAACAVVKWFGRRAGGMGGAVGISPALATPPSTSMPAARTASTQE